MLRSLKFVWLLAAAVVLTAALPATAAPVLTSISPTSGYPGTQVTYTGTGFGASQGTGSVWLGNKLAGSIVSWSNTQIVAVVAATAASGSAQVQQGGTWSNSIAFTVIAPNITSISPTSGYPGSSVTINGTNFGASQGSGSVWLGNKLAGSITSWSNTQIVAVVAATALSGSCQVQQNGVWGNSVTFTVIQPNISSISPTTGYPGNSVTINGTNFGASQGSGSVWLGNKLAGSITSWSNTQIVAVVAATAASGSAQVQQGGVWSNSITFTVITPNITSISPTSGVMGTQVTINGTNFGASQGSGTAWLGSKLAGSIVSWSNTQIVATVDSGSVTGSAIVQQGGVWSNSVTFTVNTPTLTSIDPDTARAGDEITLTGTNFGASQGSGSVWLGSKLADSIVSWSDTEIVAVVDSGSVTGTAQVQQGGVWTSSIGLTVLTPILNAVTPNIAVAGANVTLSGENFGTSQGSGSVWLGDELAGSIVSWDDTEIVVTVASGAATGTAQVQQNGVWSNSRTFTVTTCESSLTSPVSPLGFALGDTRRRLTADSRSGLIVSPEGFPSERVWIDDSFQPLLEDDSYAIWDEAQHWSGTQSFRSSEDDTASTNYIFLGSYTRPPLKVNAGESMVLYALIDECNPTGQIAITISTAETTKTFSWGDITLLENEGIFPEDDMGALPAAGTWAALMIDADAAGIAGEEILDISIVHPGGRVWFDFLHRVLSTDYALFVSLHTDFDSEWTPGTPIQISMNKYPLSAEVRFDVQDPSYVTTEIQAWSTDNTVSWTPTESGTHYIVAYVRQSGSTEWEDAGVIALDIYIPCMPLVAPEAMDPTDRIVIDDENDAEDGDHLVWSTEQHTLGTQSITKTEGESYFAFNDVHIPYEAGQSFVFYALLDECDEGDDFSISFTLAPDWEHPNGGEAWFYWGGTELDPEAAPQQIGTALEAGVWHRLEIPFSLFEEFNYDYTPAAITGFAVGNGPGNTRGWFDAFGTTCAPVADAGEITVPVDETTWFDDAPATGMTAAGDATTDSSYTRFDGTTYSYKMGGQHGTFEQSFTGATTPFSVDTGDSLFVYAQFHPCNMPKEVVVSWHVTGGDWVSAYWGADTLYENGTASAVGFYRVGELPTAEWQMLSVPAAMLGVEGLTVDGVKIETVEGLMWFQHFGSAPPRCAALAEAITAPDDEIVWFDDAVPSGATEAGTWDWVSSPVASGTLSHTDGFALGAHSHSFTGASGGPTFNSGDLFSVWAQYSYCEPPRQIAVGTGTHFAYWGENLSDFGSSGAIFTYMGPVPAAGAWRRLEVPAYLLGVEGLQITDLVFGAYDGQVWFDRASRMPQPAAITSFDAPDYVDPGQTAEITWSAVGAGTLEYQLKARDYAGDLVTLVDWSTSTTSYNFTTPSEEVNTYWLELYVRNIYGETRQHRKLHSGYPE